MPQHITFPQARNQLAKSAKGQRTIRAILDAAIGIITEDGVSAASQENIAKAAGISQSTLRHYFATKDELFTAIFNDAFEGFRENLQAILFEPVSSPLQRIEQLVSSHLDYIANSPDAYIFETMAYFARNEDDRCLQDQWYQWLIQHYASLIQQLRPDLSEDACEERAFQILTTSLGAWITLGKSRPNLLGQSKEQHKLALIQSVVNIAKQE